MKKKIVTILVVLVIISLMIPIVSQAVYQIRPNFSPLVSTSATDFFYNIRLMETSEGPMGLSMPKTDDAIYKGYNNGIDVHMMKNTEWGAVAMLAISGYGAGTQSAVGSGVGSTTGNYTGVMGMGNGNWEYMATLVTKDGTTIDETSSYAKALKNKNVDGRYYDLYDATNLTASNLYDEFYALNYKKASNYKGKKDFHGDAIYETKNLFLSANPSGYRHHVYASSPFFVRGYSGFGGVLASDSYYGDPYVVWASRAVVVCGSGL